MPAGTAALEKDWTLGLRLDDVAVLRRDRMDAEVPDAEVDGGVRDDLHQCVLAKVEWLYRRDLHPMSAWKHLRRGLNHILLKTPGAEKRYLETCDDAFSGADVSAYDDVAAVG